jgi:thioredoxin-related protein
LKIFLLISFIIGSTLAFAQYPDENDEEEYDTSYDQNLPFVEIKAAENFANLTQLAKKNGQVILLEMSATYCGFCKTLEEEIIKPMLRSGDYDHVLIRKLNIDSHYPMKDLKGNKSSPFELSSKMGVYLTPTLVFLDGDGNEVSERIIGINTLEMYGGYVDEAINQGIKSINKTH